MAAGVQAPLAPSPHSDSRPEEWPLGTKESVPQPKSLGERLERARSFSKRYPSQVPVLVDGMGNEFDERFAAWPERFYILSCSADDSQPRLHLVGEPTVEFGYDRSMVFEEVERLATKARAHRRRAAQSSKPASGRSDGRGADRPRWR